MLHSLYWLNLYITHNINGILRDEDKYLGEDYYSGRLCLRENSNVKGKIHRTNQQHFKRHCMLKIHMLYNLCSSISYKFNNINGNLNIY